MPDHLRSELPGADRVASPTGDPVGDDVLRVVWRAGEFDDRRWRRSAACRDIDPAVFFPVGATGDAIGKIAVAKAVCRGCPVRLACLQYALSSHQDDGVWGGYDEAERRELRRRWRRLGAPLRIVRGASSGPVVGPFGGAGPSDRTPEAS